MKAIKFLIKVLQLVLIFTFGYLIIAIVIGLVGWSYAAYYSLISNSDYAVFGVIMGAALTSIFVYVETDKKL